MNKNAVGTSFAVPGNVWQLGDHRLVCGDSADAATVARLMGDETVALLFADPPWGVAYESRRTTARPIRNDGAGERHAGRLLQDALALAPLRPGGAFYVCSGSGETETAFRLAIAGAGLGLRQGLVWVKQHFVLGRQDYHHMHESILYGWKPGAGHYFVPDRTQHSVWEFDRPTRSLLHPTMKPVPLVARAILNSTLPGEAVYDPFGGSGSTLMACEETGRKCRMVELDSEYVSVIVRRWQDATGKVALELR